MILPIKQMYLNALLACLMPTWYEYSVFVCEIANVAQFLFIELFLLHHLLGVATRFVYHRVTILASDAMSPDLIGLAEHLDLIKHLFKYREGLLLFHVTGWQLTHHYRLQFLEKDGVK
jgi:hypothetical protein